MRTPRLHRVLPATLAAALALALAACGGAGEPQPAEPTTPEPAAPAADPAAPDTEVPASDVDPADPVAGGNPMLTQLAGLGGAMHAAVESCEPGQDVSQLADAKDQQRQNFEQMGGDAATFEVEFTSAYDKVRAQFTNATPAQQKQMCDELAEIAAQQPQG